ncbi:hypothetical protein JYT83_00620 [bacterium AH-315-F18]|nr:hypothetical protein [bacterium AH-315-F18]
MTPDVAHPPTSRGIPMTMLRRCVLNLPVLALLFLLSSVTTADDRPALDIAATIHFGSDEMEEGARLWVDGNVELPDDLVIRVDLRYMDGPPRRYLAKVTDGGFTCNLSQGRQILAGVYKAMASVHAADQSIRHRPYFEKGVNVNPKEMVLEVGDATNIPKQHAKVRQELLSALRRMDDAYTALNLFFGHNWQLGRRAMQQDAGTLPEATRQNIKKRIRNFERRRWAEVFPTALHRFSELHERVFMLPYASAVEHFEELPKLLSSAHDAALTILGHYDQASLSEVPSRAKFDEIRRMLDERGRMLKTILNAPEFNWGHIETEAPEVGLQLGQEYFSKTTHFKVSLPEANWSFLDAGTNPDKRISLRPPITDERGIVAIGVDARFFGGATSFEDLQRRTVIRESRNWREYQLISGQPISVADESMPDGTRRGYTLLFTTNVTKDVVLKVRAHYLFCRWHKRVYGVTSAAVAEDFKAYRQDIAEINKSFAVLDDPKLDWDALIAKLKRKGAVEFAGGWKVGPEKADAQAKDPDSEESK